MGRKSKESRIEGMLDAIAGLTKVDGKSAMLAVTAEPRAEPEAPDWMAVIPLIRSSPAEACKEIDINRRKSVVRLTVFLNFHLDCVKNSPDV